MTYDLLFTEEAKEQLKALPRALQKKIMARIEQLAKEPCPYNAKKLKGYDTFYRIRFSEWRVVYDVEEQRLIITVLRVANRSTVYDQPLS